MKSEDKARFAIECSRAWLSKGREATKPVLDVWFEDLAKYPLDVVLAGLRQWRETDYEFAFVSSKIGDLCRIIKRDRDLEAKTKAHVAYLEDLSEGSKPIPADVLADRLNEIAKNLSDMGKRMREDAP
jgi:hypothetical protein